jgi:cell division protease FtsH
MITVYGMNEKLPHISLKKPDQQDFLGRDSFWSRRSEQTEQFIDNEVGRIISENYKEVIELLNDNKKQMVSLAEELLVREVLHENDVKNILDK